MTITPELIEIFQQPPMPSETNVGTVDPFTQSELFAIAAYNEQVSGLEESMPEYVEDLDIDRSMFRTAADAHRYMKLIYDWRSALDTLHSKLCAGSGSPSNAAARLLGHEAGRLVRHRDTVYAVIARWVTGMTGPRLTDGAFTLSNGYVFPDA